MRPSPAPRIHHSRATVPRSHRDEIARILIPATRVQRRVAELARVLTTEYQERDLVVVSLLSGTVLFLADLIRRLDLPLRLDFLGVSSYGGGTESGTLTYTKELRLAVQDRHVLVVDDILDTGRTLRAVTAGLQTRSPASLKTCVLLDKPSRRIGVFEADFVGFQIPDHFVVGYGMDFDERFRNLPYVGILHPHVFARTES